MLAYAQEEDLADYKNRLQKAGSLQHDGENLFDILRVSYDILGVKEKQMFLDVACIMAGWPADRAKAIWAG